MMFRENEKLLYKANKTSHNGTISMIPLPRNCLSFS